MRFVRPATLSSARFWAVALVGTLLAGASSAGAQGGRPLVLIVHGRLQSGRDSAQLRREAFEALQDGARSVSGDSLIRSSDVRLVWYADLMSGRTRTSSGSACSDLAAAAGGRREAPVNAVTLLASLAGMILDAAAADKENTDSLDVRTVAGDMRFLADMDVRCAAELRLGRALETARREHRPVILVSHSLGGLVSWDYLAHRSPSSDTSQAIVRWVTLGSPAGSAELRQLIFGEETGTFSVPAGIGSWVNVLGDADPLAVAVGDSVHVIPGVSDIRTESSHSDAHQMTSYLGDAAAVRAILGAWCDANPQRPSASCARLKASASERPATRRPQ